MGLRSRGAGALGLALGLAWTGPAATQSKPEPGPPVFGAGVSLVTLPVFVTDKDGRAVTGLVMSDFELLDEGKPAKIVAFQEIDAADPAMQEKVRSNPAARRQFLLLFDLSFSSASGLLRSRDAAMEFVTQDLGPSDLAAVATFSVTQGMKLLVGFTTDRGQLRKAIETLDLLRLERRADPLGLAFEYAQPGPPVAGVLSKDPGEGRKSFVEMELAEVLRVTEIMHRRSEEELYRGKVTGLLGALEELARALDALQGRKQVIFLSGGFEESSLVGALGTSQAAKDAEAVTQGRIQEVQSEAHFGDVAIREQLDKMVRRFPMSDAVVHTVDVTGLAARTTDVSMQVGDESPAGGGRESLTQIANRTGGRLIKDTNDLQEGLGEILEASRRYYLLAFEPEGTAPGRFHPLKVRVKGKGRSVSHRSGYVDRPSFAQTPALARRLGAAEAIAKGVSGGEIGLDALAVPYRDETGGVVVPVALEIDGASLLRREAGDVLGLEVYGYALDETGAIEDVVTVSTNLELAKSAPRIREHGLQLRTAFTLLPGRHGLRFLVRDAQTGRMGSRALDVSVPAFDGLVLYPPLFMADPADWLVLRASSKETARPPADPFRVAAEPFVPLARPRLTNGRLGRLCVLAYTGDVRYETGAQFEIKAQLLDRGGTAVPFGKLEVERSVTEADGFRRFVLNVTPADVAPGEYSFNVKLRDPATGGTSEAAQTVRVE